MFRQNFTNNLKDKIIYNKFFFNNIFNFIEIIIDFNNKLYKKIIKKDTINFKKEQKSFLN